MENEERIRGHLAEIEQLAREVRKMIALERLNYETKHGPNTWPVALDFTIGDDWDWLVGGENTDFMTPVDQLDELKAKLGEAG